MTDYADLPPALQHCDDLGFRLRELFQTSSGTWQAHCVVRDDFAKQKFWSFQGHGFGRTAGQAVEASLYTSCRETKSLDALPPPARAFAAECKQGAHKMPKSAAEARHGVQAMRESAKHIANWREEQGLPPVALDRVDEGEDEDDLAAMLGDEEDELEGML